MGYSKGKWYWEYKDGKPFNLRAKSSDKGYEADVHILFVADDFLGENSLDNEANAQLIASAPDLYEACKKIAILGANPLTTRDEPTQVMKLIRALDEMWQLARQAIAKVEG